MKITAMDHYGTISFWDMRTGQRFSQADRHTGSVNVVRFLPESRKLLSGGEDGTMRLWDIDSGKPSKIITTRKTPIQDILLSRDGKTIAISDSSAEISIRKLTADETLSRDGKTLAISDDPSRIIARQIVIGGVVRKAVTQMPMRSLYYSPDEKYLYASMSDATLARWENFAPDSYRSLGIADVGGSLVSARPESAWLTCAKSNKLRIVDLGLKTFTELPLQLLSSSATTKHKPFAMSPTGLFVAAITKTHLVIIETASGKIIQQFPSKAESTFSAIKFFGKGRLLAAGSSNGHISIFDLAEGKLVTTLETTSTPTRLSMISDIAFSTNGDILASATCDSTVTIWNIAKYTKLKKITAPADIARDPWAYLSDDDPIIANNAAWLLSSGDDMVITALEPHLTPARASTADEIALLIKKLDSIKFAQRQNAYKRLEDMGPIPENSMKKALESNPSPESTVLLENLLAGMNRAVKSTPIKLGKIRAIGVLEQIATNQAIKILKKLASGDPAARVTKDAKGALARINVRKVRKN